jgi:glutamate 5-kinase
MSTFQRIVIKIGTSTLTAGGKKLAAPQMADMVHQLSELTAEGKLVVLVSSGAIAVGKEVLGFPSLPKQLPAKQMLAAVGQPRLMATYDQFFSIYSIKVAQVLLTRADLADQHGYLNARATLEALLNQKIIPIINENDTVSTDEIRFGDNDNLSAQVANLIEADLLILLTDQDGLYTADPRTNKNVQLIHEIGPEPFSSGLWQSVGGSTSGLGTGGMATKLEAADLARHGGTTVVITRGSIENGILRVAHGEMIGTRISPMINKLEGRKRRLVSGIRTKSEIMIDAGAIKALHNGSSLLPAGILKVIGTFDRGNSIRVIDSEKKAVAVGQSNYGTADLLKIKGQKSSEIEKLLGYSFGEEVIHRDNLVML